VPVRCDVGAGRFDILSDWNKQKNVTQNFQEIEFKTLVLTAVPSGVLKGNQMADV